VGGDPVTAFEDIDLLGEAGDLLNDGWDVGTRQYRYQVTNQPEAVKWLLANIGARGLAGFFRRRGLLVHTSRVDENGYIEPATEDDDNGPATVATATARTVVAHMAAAPDFDVYREKKAAGGLVVEEACLFPANAAELALEVLSEAPNLRPLRGVTHTPMVRQDGSVLDRPGYDDASGFLCLPTVDVAPVPERPTAERVAKSVALLRGMIGEFAWAGEHDEAAFLGLLITPLLRELCPPPYKLGGLMAHQRGSGKSLLASIIRIVHGGVFRSELPHDDAEMSKVLTSVLSQTTAPVVVFDNVSGMFRSSRFDGLLTSDVYSDRILGSTNNVEMVNDRLWLVTGNNLVLGGDLDRRTLLVTIDPMVPKPELRTGFALDLATWVPEHRGEILHALLVLVRAWVQAGKPSERRSSDSYARWSATVRGILRVAGVPGEFDHASCAPEQASTDPDGWGDFLQAVRAVFGDRPWTAKDVLGKVHSGHGGHVIGYENSHPIELDALPPELAEKFVRGGPPATSRALGVWLRNRNRRFVGDLTGAFMGTDRTNTARWRVLTADELRSLGSAA
jgi:hypothetical protein